MFSYITAIFVFCLFLVFTKKLVYSHGDVSFIRLSSRLQSPLARAVVLFVDNLLHSALLQTEVQFEKGRKFGKCFSYKPRFNMRRGDSLVSVLRSPSILNLT